MDLEATLRPWRDNKLSWSDLNILVAAREL
jgi:hypothetical protein